MVIMYPSFLPLGPIIEPTEFTSRYFAHIKGTSTLSIEGQMIAMLLVTWAASFGVNEYGLEEEIEPHSPTMPDGPKFSPDADDDFSDPSRRARTLRVETMIREILHLIDIHALLRRPTWDGVRVLLLILPLTQGMFIRDSKVPMLMNSSGIQSSMDRGVSAQLMTLNRIDRPFSDHVRGDAFPSLHTLQPDQSFRATQWPRLLLRCTCPCQSFLVRLRTRRCPHCLTRRSAISVSSCHP